MKTLLIALMTLTAAATSAQTKKKIDVTKSKLYWVGKKITGEHKGTLNFRDGMLSFKGKSLTGGTFTVDMASITVTDLASGKGKESLEGHLKADDFFGVDKYDTATLSLTSATAKGKGVYTVKGNMTIKGITNAVNFDMTVGSNTAKANFMIDRTKYDIKYGSGTFFTDLQDKAINDEFEITVNLSF